MGDERDLYQGYALQGIDRKGRVAIPQALRDTVVGNSGERVLLIGDELRLPCMTAYDRCWSKLLKARLEVDYARAQDRGGDIDRAVDALANFANVDEVAFDEAGRFILPKYVIDTAQLDGFAFFAGAGDTVQIWNPERLLASDQVPQRTRDRCAWAMREKGLAA